MKNNRQKDKQITGILVFGTFGFMGFVTLIVLIQEGIKESFPDFDYDGHRWLIGLGIAVVFIAPLLAYALLSKPTRRD